LYSEKDRWGLGIEEFGAKLEVLIGDALISSAFVSYVGPFSKMFRDELVNDHFKKFILKKGIPSSDNPDPMEVLVD
jgi:dynein heavy chain